MNSVPRVLVTVSGTPRVVRILPRGNWLDESGEVVTPAVPHFLQSAPASAARATRLDLARWIVARDNPLTARVFVNRLWKLLFGQGLVQDRSDDFGSQGRSPTHPELLDWLAVEFMDSGWDVKHMVKLMVMSSSLPAIVADAPELNATRDPYNRWLARQGRFRLDAEMVRDNALAISGLLSSRRSAGPASSRISRPATGRYLEFPARAQWQNDQGENQYRRGLYTYW